ncbi:Metabotropic glutamate receptor 8 [Holothuria leucospilota]|uniref:Metabotropic glutamate receptor 8 n=1 Tax=Holothuria leucospilota TaxID=206669 RepID=A0A9Q1BQ72_HOLLE|nr:Metabotropic glutamate receptor 8 [Holothuria leucospilota]
MGQRRNAFLEHIPHAMCFFQLVLLVFLIVSSSEVVTSNNDQNAAVQGEGSIDRGQYDFRPERHSLSAEHVKDVVEAFKLGKIVNLKYSRFGGELENLGLSVEKLTEISDKIHFSDSERCENSPLERGRRGVEEPNKEDEEEFDNDRVAFSWGQAVLGGLFAVYRRDRETNEPCQDLYNVAAMWVESQIYAVKKINSDPNILPNIQLGYEIRDDCSDNNKVLQAGLQFVDAMAANGSCDDSSKTVGVVGTGSSLTSDTLAKLLALFEVPQVSYSATSPIFSNKQEYPYFLRTVGPDTNQAKVLVDIAKRFNWNYVALVYSGDQYGSPGQEALSELFKDEQICAVVSRKLSTETSDDEVVQIVEEIKGNPKIEVIFTFTSKPDIKRILAEAQKQGLTYCTWIATDSWGDSLETIDGFEDVVNGMLGVTPKAVIDEDFKEYLRQIDPFTYTDNPWYKESLEERYGCTFNKSDLERNHCIGNESFLDLLESPSEGRVTSLVIDAVNALAYGLHNMVEDCSGPGCNTTRLSQFDGEEYLVHVQNVSFPGFTSDPFGFDANGDPFTQYSIFNLNVSGGAHHEEIGFWKHDCGLNLTEPVIWSTGVQPISRCSEDCQPGSFVVNNGPVTCCWDCQACGSNEVSPGINSATCIRCDISEFANANHTRCISKELVAQDWRQTSSALILVASLIGILASLFTFVIYVVYRKTPVIKATSTELSLMCLVGLTLCFVCVPLTIAEPTDVICQSRSFITGVSFSILAGALLMKTYRISRIFNRKLSEGRPSMFLQIKFQILFVLTLVSAQVALGVINFILYPTFARYNYSLGNTAYKECQGEDGSVLWFSLAVVIGYNFVLGMICNYQAFRIRQLPGQFNDSKSIFFTILTLNISFFIIVVISLATTGKIRSIGLCLSLLICSYSGLSLLFGRKLWVVLFRPKSNVHTSTFDAALKKASSLSPATTLSSHQEEVNGNTPNRTKTESDDFSEDDDIFDSGNYSDVSTVDEDEEDIDEFLEEVAKLEEELQSAQRERHASIQELHQLKEDLRELEESHGKDLERMKELCKQERQSLIEILQQAGLSPEEIQAKLDEVAEQKSRNGSSTDQNEEDEGEKIAAIEREWKKLNDESEACLAGCQKMKETFFPNGITKATANGNSCHGYANQGLESENLESITTSV